MSTEFVAAWVGVHVVVLLAAVGRQVLLRAMGS